MTHLLPFKYHSQGLGTMVLGFPAAHSVCPHQQAKEGILFRCLRVTLSSLFRRLRDGEGFNRHYNSLIVLSYDLQQFGHMAFSISVVYKRSECYESASSGFSLYHPMKDQ